MKVLVAFPQDDDASASHQAAELEQILKNDGSKEAVTRESQPGAMDLGTMLGIVLGAESVVWLARGLYNVLTRYRSKVEIRFPDGTIVSLHHTMNSDEIVDKILKTISKLEKENG